MARKSRSSKAAFSAELVVPKGLLDRFKLNMLAVEDAYGRRVASLVRAQFKDGHDNQGRAFRGPNSLNDTQNLMSSYKFVRETKLLKEARVEPRGVHRGKNPRSGRINNFGLMEVLVHRKFAERDFLNPLPKEVTNKATVAAQREVDAQLSGKKKRGGILSEVRGKRNGR